MDEGSVRWDRQAWGRLAGLRRLWRYRLMRCGVARAGPRVQAASLLSRRDRLRRIRLQRGAARWVRRW
jgi:hypothetical protein